MELTSKQESLRIEAKFEKVLEPIHKHFWKRVYTKLRKKISTLKTSLKKRAEEHEVSASIKSGELRDLFLKHYGKPCRYCKRKLTIKNMVCDHVVPLVKGGGSDIDNLQLICKSCNTRKGPLDEKSFRRILKWLSRNDEEVREYVLRKLAKGGRY